MCSARASACVTTRRTGPGLLSPLATAAGETLVEGWRQCDASVLPKRNAIVVFSDFVRNPSIQSTQQRRHPRRPAALPRQTTTASASASVLSWPSAASGGTAAPAAAPLAPSAPSPPAHHPPSHQRETCRPKKAGGCSLWLHARPCGAWCTSPGRRGTGRASLPAAPASGRSKSPGRPSPRPRPSRKTRRREPRTRPSLRCGWCRHGCGTCSGSAQEPKARVQQPRRVQV